jgi:hypothetical protein
MVKTHSDLVVRLHWQYVVDEDDPRWGYQRTLYAYLAPHRPEVLYLGKCDGTTVRARWSYSAKTGAWDFINNDRGLRSHRLIVADIEMPSGSRLTRELLSDIESLLINRIDVCANIQCRSSRIRRSGLEVRCLGAWPLGTRAFRDS